MHFRLYDNIICIMESGLGKGMERYDYTVIIDYRIVCT